MPLIHIEPVELRSASHRLQQDVRALLEEDFHIHQALSHLDMAWEGPDSENFQAELRNLQSLLRERIRDLYQLTLILSRTAERWEESDMTWRERFREVAGFFGGGKE